MDAGQLHKLARALREVALDATSGAAEDRPNAAEILVATDIFEHSPTTVGEIVARTGVVQSQVSTIIATLHAADVVTREADPRDRRRTLIAVPPRARKVFGTDRGRRDIRQALSAYLTEHKQPSKPDDVECVDRLLVELAGRLAIGGSRGSRAQ